MVRTHRLLDARMDVRLSHIENDSAIYNVELGFTDLFGKQRSHSVTIDLPKNQSFEERISFTAMSSVNMRAGVVVEVTRTSLRIMLVGGDTIGIVLHRGQSFQPGDVVSIIEHANLAEEGNPLEYIALAYPLVVESDSLRLQSVNADILDASGNLLHRFSVDPLLKRQNYVTRVAA